MSSVEARLIPLSPSTPVKMEERKRPAPSDHDDSAPPSKRQATAINGSSKNHHDSDLPGKDELEVGDSHPKFDADTHGVHTVI